MYEAASLSASSGYPRIFSPWCSPARLFIQRLVMAFHKYHRCLSFLQMRHFLPGTEDYPVEENGCEHVIWEKRNNRKYMVWSGLFKSYLIIMINYFDISNNCLKSGHSGQQHIWTRELFEGLTHCSTIEFTSLDRILTAWSSLKITKLSPRGDTRSTLHFLVSALGNSQTILQLSC